MNSIRQIYVDEGLLDEVAKVSPYSQNPNLATRNVDDLFLYMMPSPRTALLNTCYLEVGITI